jgi:DNA repair protein RecN (Recombination protein N)
MLLELMVENYAVVENVRVRFRRGFNVLTGETGSGKSIVVDALGLLFGGRASAEMLRSGSERARVAGIFEVPETVKALLAESGIEPEDNEILIEREITANGKSRAFVSNRMVTAGLLRDIAANLGDIHGQHDQQRLFSAESQLDIVDQFAGAAPLIEQARAAYPEWRSCARELEQLELNEQEKLRLLDLWSFQRNEIESARLKPGEDTALEQERRVLQNVTKLLESANAAYGALYDAPESVYAQMRIALRKLEELCRIDDSLRDAIDTLKPAEIAVAEASGVLRDYLGRLEADPDRLEQVENRLVIIDKLKRKYGASVEDILVFVDQVRENIDAVENAAARRVALEKQRSALAQQYEHAAASLSSKRRDAARKLEKRVQSELKSLAMERTVFQVEFRTTDWGPSGTDAVAFRVSPNVGEEPRPLEKVASGGELSRLAHALKTCVSEGSKRPGTEGRILVFDEVDAGIGGAAADTVGRRLKMLAGGDQVLCVTHLAQIAGFGDAHFVVEKREVRGRTVATVEELTGEARTREIGRMLSGQRLTPEALKHAEQLIRTSAAE